MTLLPFFYLIIKTSLCISDQEIFKILYVTIAKESLISDYGHTFMDELLSLFTQTCVNTQGRSWSIMLITRFTLVATWMYCMHMFNNSFYNWQISLITDRYYLYWAPWSKDCAAPQMSNPKTLPQSTMPIGHDWVEIQLLMSFCNIE